MSYVTRHSENHYFLIFNNCELSFPENQLPRSLQTIVLIYVYKYKTFSFIVKWHNMFYKFFNPAFINHKLGYPCFACVNLFLFLFLYVSFSLLSSLLWRKKVKFKLMPPALIKTLS